LKTILGKLEPVAGGLTWGVNVTLDYFDQELSNLDFSSTVIEEIAAVAPSATAGELRGYLAKFLFTGDDVYKSVSALSGGEKSRLALAKIIYSRANVLVLDEPTNHLDIPSREALEQALAEYKGTIITVSHDRYFLDRIATEILHFEDGAANYFTGSYSDYYAYRHRQAVEERTTTQKRNELKPRKGALKSQAKKRSRDVGEIEKEIHTLELELEDINKRLSNPAPDWGPEQYAEHGNRQEAISDHLSKLYHEWESASSE
jgi:ATP-binding cassette subfamily F protein 3